jgi:hypothetical protein
MADLLFFDWPSEIDLFAIQLVLMVAAACLAMWVIDAVNSRRARSAAPEGKGPQPARPPADL